MIQGDNYEKELKTIEENVDQYSLKLIKEDSESSLSLPKIIFDNTIYKEIESFGIPSTGTISNKSLTKNKF